MRHAHHPHQALIVIDLGFGDAGKGSIVAALTEAQAAHTVVRFNGGAQAAHNVVTVDGRHHTFAQLGSGTFTPGVQTLLSRYMLVDPLALLSEAEHLASVGVSDALDRLLVEREAVVVTPIQQALNRLRELARGDGRHGSCGMGIGETMSDLLTDPACVVRVGDLPDRATVRRKIAALRQLKRAALAEIADHLPATAAVTRERAPLDDPDIGALCADLYAHIAARITLIDRDEVRRQLQRPGTVIFEGAQGVLLDEWHGFHPYTTWSTTTGANAATVLAEADYAGAQMRLGVVRAYATRHGAGPFVTEDAALGRLVPEPHNGLNPWQRAFRIGHLDLVATRYALAVTGPLDGLAVTNLDRLPSDRDWLMADAYDYQGDPAELAGFVSHTGRRVSAIEVVPPPALEHQAALTERLDRCRPCYRPLAAAGPLIIPTACRQLEAALGLPVVLASTGPTSADKRWLPDGARAGWSLTETASLQPLALTRE